MVEPMKATILQRPNLAVIVGNYPPEEPFIQRHLHHLCGGVGLIIVLGKDSGKRLNFPGERIWVVSDPTVQTRSSASRRLWSLWSFLRYFNHRVPNPEQSVALVQKLEELGIEAVIGEFGTHSATLYPALKKAGLPHFAYFRGVDATARLAGVLRAFFNGARYRKMAKNLDGMFAVSKFIQDNLRRHGVRHDNFHVIPSGTDLQNFSPAEKERDCIVAIGRFVGKKAPHVTIGAFLAVAERYPNAVLHMVGDGPMFDDCVALAAQHHRGHQICFHGRLQSEDIRNLLGRASLFMQHSVTASNGDAEGLPSAIQEAMAAGCAILSTRHAGIPEAVIEGRNGYLSDEADQAEFTRLLDKMLGDPDALSHFGRESRILAEEKFDYRNLFAKIESVIAARIAARAGDPK